MHIGASDSIHWTFLCLSFTTLKVKGTLLNVLDSTQTLQANQWICHRKNYHPETRKVLKQSVSFHPYMYLKEAEEQIDSRSSTSSRDWRYCTVPLAWLVCLDWRGDRYRRKNEQDGWTMTCACPSSEGSLIRISMSHRFPTLRGAYYVLSTHELLSWLTRARSKYIRPHVSNGSSVHVINGHPARHLKVGSSLPNHPYSRVLITYIWIDVWWWL